MATGGQNSQIPEHEPIQETVHDSPSLTPRRTDLCEAVELIQTFKIEINTTIDSMKSELSRKSILIDRLMQDREKTHGELENLKQKLNLMEREKSLDEREHQKELHKKNEEIKRLRDRNQELETKVKDLTEEKDRLEECIRNHTHKVEALEAKLDNLMSQNINIKQELKTALETVNQHKCNHGPESLDALEARMLQKMEKMTEMLSNLRTGEQSLSPSSVDKLMDKSGSSSKSNMPISTSLPVE